MDPDDMTTAGPVTITRADGSTEVRPAYESEELNRIIREGYARARYVPHKRRILRQIAQESAEDER